jgi:hypothetical protein
MSAVSKVNQAVIATIDVGFSWPTRPLVQILTDFHDFQRKTQHNSMTNIFQSLLLVIAGVTQKELVRQVKI